MSTEELPPRESMEFDVVIVGAGPSGLSAAIQLKQLNSDLTIVVVEKGSEVGAHNLSGAVIDPVSLDKLVPDWREDAECPLKTQVKTDKFYWMTEGTAIPLPGIGMPPLMNNHHCYIGARGGRRGSGPDRSGRRDVARDRDEVGIGEPVDRRLRQRTVDPGLQIEGQQLRNGGRALRRHGGMSGASRHSRADRAAAKRPPAHFRGCSSAKNRKQTNLGNVLNRAEIRSS